MEIFDKDHSLAIFQVRVADLNQTVSTLRRFLVAREYNLEAAEIMIRKSIEWHHRHKQLLAAKNRKLDNRVTLKQFPREMCGIDYSNRVVVYFHAGIYPVKGTIEMGLRDELYLFVCMLWEQIEDEIAKAGVGEQCCGILDLEGLSFGQVVHYDSIRMGAELLEAFAANFPERLGEFLLINVPRIFDLMWRAMKSFLPKKTMEKFVILGSDPDVYLPEILKRMPATCLPRKLAKIAKMRDLI